MTEDAATTDEHLTPQEARDEEAELHRYDSQMARANPIQPTDEQQAERRIAEHEFFEELVGTVVHPYNCGWYKEEAPDCDCPISAALATFADRLEAPLKERIERLEADKAGLSARLTLAEQEIVALNEDVASIEGIARQRRTWLESREAQVKTLEKRLASSLSTIVRLRTGVEAAIQRGRAR